MNRSDINNLVRPYAKASDRRAYWQVINTVIPYFGLLTLMYFMIDWGVNYFFVLLVSVIPALFLVRIFILFHDCTHSSFMKSKKAMNVFGHLFGILVFTPFHKWQREHLTHHRTVGNIDKRGTGDVWTMTVDEYENSSRMKKFGYRLYRSPFVLFLIGPSYVFLINQRMPSNWKNKKDWLSLNITNVSVILIILVVWLTIGLKFYFMIQLPIIIIAATLGVWLFYVQHQYEEVYWASNKNWSITEAAMEGSSVYRLPRILDWFTGNIGYHNVHHLNARVPNYRLRKLYHSSKKLKSNREIKIFSSLKLARLFLYDVKNKQLISYKKFKKVYR